MSDKQALVVADRGQPATDIHLVDKTSFAGWLAMLSLAQRGMVEAQRFMGGGYEHAIVPDGEGWFAVAGVADRASLSSWCLAKLATALPPGSYR
ncbi:MAG: leucyl aminopeptidase family protein, partial [Rhizorhabdus sp.]